MDEQKKKAPDLRFKGFTDDWEQRKLKTLTSIYDGTHQTPKYQQNGVMFLSVENIGSLKSNKFISEKDYENNFKVKPTFHDILMTRIGTVGKANVINTHQPIAYYVSLALIHPIHIKPYFLSYLIQSQTIQKEIFRRTLQVAFPQKINKDEIGKINIWLPNKNEQSKIEVVLSHLYTLITLQQKKLSLLKQLKKGLLQKMFADQDVRKPVLRFKNFHGEWEQRKLGEISDPIKSYSYTRKYETNNVTGFKYIHYGDIHTGNAKEIGDPNELPSIIKGNYSKLTSGDIVVADASEDYKGIADAAILLNPGAFSVIAGLHTIAFRPNNELVFPMFVYYILQTNSFKHYGYHVGTGLKVFGISSKSFFNYLASYPSLTEQQNISKLIKLLEKLITLQQNRLNQLKLIKKFLLQKLFI